MSGCKIVSSDKITSVGAQNANPPDRRATPENNSVSRTTAI
jgi:hypothetical protein